MTIIPKNSSLIYLHHTGCYADLSNPKVADINICDIAHALARINRFNGHTKLPYNVAHHSLLVAHVVPQKYKLAALLHDASEAYLGDVSSPLKALLPDYQTLEKTWQTVIAKAFGIPAELHDYIKHADLKLLATEKRDLLSAKNNDRWGVLNGIRPLKATITPYSIRLSEQLFLNTFEQLTRGQHVA